MSKKICSLVSPVSGRIIPIENVNDDVFSGKILGDGVAVELTDGKVVSPFDGEIVSVAETKHAYGIKSDDGTEILAGVETSGKDPDLHGRLVPFEIGFREDAPLRPAVQCPRAQMSVCMDHCFNPPCEHLEDDTSLIRCTYLSKWEKEKNAV